MANDKKMITPTLLALLATIAGAFAAWWSAREQDAYNNKLIEAQKEITRLNNEIAQSVTGGDGYCFVNFFPKQPGIAEVDVISDSKYPLYDIEIRIRPWIPSQDFEFSGDATDLNTNENFTERKRQGRVDSNYYEFKVGTLPSMKSQIVTSRKLGTVSFGHQDRWFYTVDFTARNGEWRQVWDFSFNKDGRAVGSHVIYKVVVENNTKKNLVLNRFPNPDSPTSIVNSLITEYKPFDPLTRVLIRED